MIAQQGLANTLHPAAIKLLSSFSQFLRGNKFEQTSGFIDKFQVPSLRIFFFLSYFILHFQEEILLFVNGLLQLHYLKKYNSSFTEHFYGIERDFQSNNAALLSWIGLVLIPYIRRKVENAFLRSRENLLDGVESTNARKALVKAYPHIHLLCQCIDIGRYR